MDLTLSPEQTDLGDAVARMLATTAATTDPWAGLAEMGLLGLDLPEEHGGAGGTFADVSVVARALGRAGARTPYVEGVIGGHLAPRLDGLVVLAHDEPGRRWKPGAGVHAEPDTDADGTTWRLTGTKEPVPHGGAADHLVVSATGPEGLALFVVAPSDAAIHTYASHDRSPTARIDLDRTPAALLAGPDQAAALLVEASVRAVTAYGAEALGAMEEALDRTVDYLRTRRQFGVPLASFQALTHRAADAYVALELARSTVLYGTACLTEGVVDPAVASRIKVQTGRAGRLIGQEAIQLHGGIGVTDEHGIGYFTARLEVIEHLWGDTGFHLQRLAAGLGDHRAVDLLP
ncbi:acyl-CoA dehydrogenase family protein [Pimelobacter sp. 30-1]|uniref:acyl-CoA dehydrogenase family protein n=1 Tax=Pimelobacter sp. 30-1 TaxID=2004991 RepID=UPI001C048DD5|nr:acyl-CoA dehydrogenase family protein [Pimelobacter sp. 30-1]MBU2693569.1 hypothetical protein [Pimelobacter sp. 30-1]